MIAFAAPKVLARRELRRKSTREAHTPWRLDGRARPLAVRSGPQPFPFARAKDRVKGQARGWRKLGPRLSSMDPTLVKAGLRPPPPAAAALTRVGSIDKIG